MDAVRIVAYIRPHKLEEVKTAIAELGVGGISVCDVRGCGASEEPSATVGGQVILIPLPIRSKVVTVVSSDLKDAVIEAILRHAGTGQSGDGKIFVEPVLDALRVRTSERGPAAL